MEDIGFPILTIILILILILIYIQTNRIKDFENIEIKYDEIQNNFTRIADQNFNKLLQNHTQAVNELIDVLISEINRSDIRNKLGGLENGIMRVSEETEILTEKLRKSIQESEKFNNEIRKRDAIIERKNKQIRKLKNEI